MSMRVPGDAVQQGGADDALGVEAAYRTPIPRVGADDRARRARGRRRRRREYWRSGETISTSMGLFVRPGASVGTRKAFSSGPRRGRREERVGVVDVGHVVLLAGQHPRGAFAAGAHPDVVGVGTGVGLGDGEAEHLGAVREARQPFRLCSGVPNSSTMVAHTAGDSATSMSGRPASAIASATTASASTPAPAAAVLLRDAGAERADAAEGAPQLAGVVARDGRADVVLVPEVAAGPQNGLPQLVQLRRSLGCRAHARPPRLLV